MKIVIACDHGGFPLKSFIKQVVLGAGHDVVDVGSDSHESVDYPDYAQRAGLKIISGEAERGIILCGSGVGASIAANKIKGIYAAVCHDTYTAHQGVEHDNMNVLCLGARVIGPELAREIVLAFLCADFLPDERFQRRFKKVQNIEKTNK
jgi:ribose 5-phosphate isomerase B